MYSSAALMKLLWEMDENAAPAALHDD